MTVALKCSQCGRVFELWPEPFHYWWTRGGTRLICQGTRWQATRAEPDAESAKDTSHLAALSKYSGEPCGDGDGDPGPSSQRRYESDHKDT